MLFAKHKVRNLCRSTTQWSLSSISHDGRHLCTTKDQSQCWGDFPGGSDGKSCCLQCRRPWFNPWAGKIPWRRKWLPTPVLLPGKSHGRRSLVGYSPWGRKESDMTEQLHFSMLRAYTYPVISLQSFLGGNTEKARYLIGTAKSHTKAVSLLGIEKKISTAIKIGIHPHSHYTVNQNLLNTYYLPEFAEKAMAPHSSTLAWKIPWTEEPGGLQSMRLLRVGHNWATSLSLFTFMHWRRKWQPAPVFLPGESQGRRTLVGCCLCGRTESDTTEAT